MKRSPRIVPKIDPAELERCLEKIRIALERTNRDQAIAAIDYALGYQAAAPVVEFSTPIADLGLDVRTSNLLEANGIKTVGALCGTTPAELERLPQAGEKMIIRLRELIERYDLTPRNPAAWRNGKP